MLFKLEELLYHGSSALINNKWVPARPINYKYTSLWRRLKLAWLVFTRKADVVIWPEGQ